MYFYSVQIYIIAFQNKPGIKTCEDTYVLRQSIIKK